MPAGWQRLRPVKNSDVVEPKEAALEDIRPVGIFAIHPPGEVQQQFVKDFLEKIAIGNSTDSPFDFINAKRSPGMYRRIHVAKCPLIRGQLPVGMHVPFAKKKNEL